MNIEDCNECNACIPNEKEQTKNYEPHMCILLGEQLFHRTNKKEHYKIHPDLNCPINNGYISTDGEPLKCNCGCTDLEEYNEYFEDYGLKCEYSVRCKKCSEKLGVWAYGHWCLF